MRGEVPASPGTDQRAARIRGQGEPTMLTATQAVSVIAKNPKIRRPHAGRPKPSARLLRDQISAAIGLDLHDVGLEELLESEERGTATTP